MAKSPSLRGVAIGAIGATVLLGAIGLLVVLTGAYNVAASVPHAPPVAWALDTTMHNSVQSRAEGVDAPPGFTPAMIAAGAGEYKAMCEHCHGGIGRGRAEWARGMRPHPPPLARAAQGWSAREVFWIVKHGVKMTGMPAFGPTHDDATLWNIAAFVKAMPRMNQAQYARLTPAGDHHTSGEGSHVH